MSTPNTVRNVCPPGLNLAVLLAILGGLLVIDFADIGHGLQTARPYELAAPVEDSRILRPKAACIAIRFITGRRQELCRRPPCPSPALLSLR